MFDVNFFDSLDHRLELARKCLRSKDPRKIIEEATCDGGFNSALLFGYIRSFVRLALLSDVQSVANELGITRQSVKRHITELENLLDARLFDSVGVVSNITPAGTLWLPRAQEIAELSRTFLARTEVQEARYQCTQLPLRMLLGDERNSALLRGFARAWMMGDQKLESPWFSNFEDYCILYERKSGQWSSQKIGGRSAFSDWYGADIAKESEGKNLAAMTTGEDLEVEISFLLDEIYTKGGMHFSEVACNLPGLDQERRSPLLYQRLLAETMDQAGNPIVASIIQIIGLHQTDPMRD